MRRGAGMSWLAILVTSIGCQFEHGTVPLSTDGDVSARCPGYGAITPWGSRYRVGTEPLAWPEAEARCAMDGSTTYLAAIGDVAERDEVVMLPADNVWIGASDRAVETTWRDVTGDVTTFTPWLDNEPSTKPDEDCALMVAKGAERGGYDAKNCPERHLYVCECDG